MTRQFFSTGLDRVDAPDFAHMLRVATTQRTQQFFNAEWRERLGAWDPATALDDSLPKDFGGWGPLERDQYVEAHTLLSGYLLSSQGDRMAMAASVEARYPFLDHRVIEFACRLPARLKLRGLREKVLLKKAMADEIPAAIVAPHQAAVPRARQFELLSAMASRFRTSPNCSVLRGCGAPGMFDPMAVGKLQEKCRAGRAIGFADNMAFVGVLSTMLLHEQFIERPGAAVTA